MTHTPPLPTAGDGGRYGFGPPKARTRTRPVMRRALFLPTRLRPAVVRTMVLGLVASAAHPVLAKFDIPTGAPPSPLYGAQPFTQPMLRFEEFGLQRLPGSECPKCSPLPAPPDCASSPDGAALDAFLGEALHPLPRRAANTSLANPWSERIAECVRPLASSVIEGRPPGEYFAHQRWDEFRPQVYFQSAQAGARTNGGLRDALQRHGYSSGEFGPGGLYHNTTRDSGSAGTTRGITVRLHPLLPAQDSKALWTFDGTLPPKLLMARYGEPILFRHYDALPVDPAANYGFGLHTLTTHEHNGHTPAESDGYTQAYFFPGQFYDYRWPMVLAGHDRINTDASDPRAATPDGQGGALTIPGDWRETMSTHWFHDHMLDFTAQNVYKGNAAMMNYYSALDRGNEGLDCHYEDPAHVNLCFPSGTALDWGNRDYDVNLLVADKAWDRNGQLFFNIFNLNGFLGDRMTVNWLYKPYLDVRARKYRLRILNGSVSRHFKIALVDAAGNRVPFYLIANDGNIMEHAVRFPNAESQDLPEQGIAERYDIIVDFGQFEAGERLYLVNLLEHENGRGPERAIALQEVLQGLYQGDPAVGSFLEFRVQPFDGQDLSMDPAEYLEGGKTMIPLPRITADELAAAKHRSFEFGRSNGTDTQPWTIKTDGGQGLGMDPRRLSAAPEEGALEIWHLENGGDGWSHAVHIHFEEGQILKRGGKAPPAWEKWARKDVYRLGPLPDSLQSVDVAIRFREFLGTYMEHCHNTQHEDNAMLLRWDVQNPGQLVAMPTPLPEWEGVFYEPSFTLATYQVGDLDAAEDFLASLGEDPVHNLAPSADFTTQCTGLDCSFTDASSDSDGSITAWAWDFGDGATAFEASPEHQFAAAGDYTVSLTVTDDAGAAALASAPVTVSLPNAPPTAGFSFTCTGLSCRFADGSSDSDGAIAAWSWYFGDGQTAVSQHPQHAYAVPGAYQVMLIVTDDAGSRGGTTQLVVPDLEDGGEAAAVWADFGGDGKADILLRHSDTGRLYLYQMDGHLRTGSAIGALSPSWEVAGIADLGGDRKADMLLRHSDTGQLYLYEMDGSVRHGSNIGSLNPVWAVAGLGDFGGDGKADILLRHSDSGRLYLYQMDGRLRTGSPIGALDPAWKIVGIGDLGGDGKADIVLRHSATGELYLYEMDGNVRTGSAIGSLSPSWDLAGLGDFGGDGKTDLLLRHGASGHLYLYEMDGHLWSGSSIGNLHPDWKVVQVADFGGDGKADILLRHRDTGRLFLYQMDGATRRGSAVGGLAAAWVVQ